MTYGMYTYGMYTYGMYTYGMYTYGMYTYGMYTYVMYTYVTNLREWRIYKNDEFSEMTNFRDKGWFFLPFIFYPLRALGSEYLRSCFHFDLCPFQNLLRPNCKPQQPHGCLKF